MKNLLHIRSGWEVVLTVGLAGWWTAEARGQNATSVEQPANPQAVLRGGIGVGTRDTKAEFKDMLLRAADGTTLLKPDFAKGISLTSWQREDGQWDVAGGVLSQNSRAINCQLFTVENTWTNYTYSLKARRTEGTEGFLIIFAEADNRNLYWWNIGGWNNTRSAVEEIERGGRKEIPGTAVGLRIETGTWYDIKLTVKGDAAECYFDGKLITTLKNDIGQSTMPDAGPPTVVNHGSGPKPVGAAAELTTVDYWHGTPARVAPPPALPALEQVAKLAPISLKTAGHSPKEAFDMLGKAVGVSFMPGRERPSDALMRESAAFRREPPLGALVWESRANTRLDFDVENVSFWQAALQFGDASRLFAVANNHRVFLLEQPPTLERRPLLQAMDAPAHKVNLYSGLPSKAEGENYHITDLSLEFLVDPRIALLAVGDMEIQAIDDSTGKRLDTRLLLTSFPGQGAPLVRPMGFGGGITLEPTGHGMLVVSYYANVRTETVPATIEVFRGYSSAVVATATQPLEYELKGGMVTDQAPHRVGDWRVTVSNSGDMPIAGRGGRQPDHALTVTVERLSDDAPPFPVKNAALVSCDAPLTWVDNRVSVSSTGSRSSIVAPAVKDPKKQEWPVYLFVTDNRAGPAPTKLIIDVPTAVREVVLPFEFKQVVLGP